MIFQKGVFVEVETRAKVGGKYLEYKGKPLVREGDTICYGDMEDKCILILEIMSHKKTENGELPDKILIQVVDPKNQSNILRQASLSMLIFYKTLYSHSQISQKRKR